MNESIINNLGNPVIIGPIGRPVYSISLMNDTEPIYNANIHTSVKYEDFESYANITALKAAYAWSENGHGTLNLETSNPLDDTKSLRVNWEDDGDLGGGDATVLLEIGTGAGAEVHRDWYISFSRAFQSGYSFDGYRGEKKEFYVFRGVSGGASDGTLPLTAGPGNQTNLPNLTGTFPDAGTRWWWWSNPTTVTYWGTQNQEPTVGGSARYGQNLAYSSTGAGGIYKDPLSICDGLKHRITLHIRHESAQDVGDGLIEMWVDGTKVMHYNGTDVTDPYYQAVYTTPDTYGWKAVQIGPVFNGGSPQTQDDYWDNLRVYYLSSS